MLRNHREDEGLLMAMMKISDQDGRSLPQDWEWSTLDKFRKRKRESINPAKSPNQKYELYSVPSFENTKPEIVFGKEIGSSKLVVHKGEVLICKINPRINRSWIVSDHSKNPKIASTEWFVFDKAENLNPKYLCYYMQMDSFRDYLAANVSGVGGSLMRARSSSLENYPFPLAPLPEQERIVSRIEELFSGLEAGVAALERVRAGLKRYKASVLKAAVEGKLVEQNPADEPAIELLKQLGQTPLEDDNLSPIPKGWCWVNWEQIGKSQNGRGFPSKEYQAEGVKLLRPGNLFATGEVIWTEGNTRYLPEKWENEFPQFVVRENELVINLTAQSLKDEFLGRVCLTSSGEHCLLNQRLARLTPLVGEKQFFLILFKSKLFRKFVDGLNKGSLIQHMFTSQLAEFTIPLPPLDEQRRIVAEVERRLSVVSEVESVVEAGLIRASRLRQAILRSAFEGRL